MWFGRFWLAYYIAYSNGLITTVVGFCCCCSVQRPIGYSILIIIIFLKAYVSMALAHVVAGAYISHANVVARGRLSFGLYHSLPSTPETGSLTEPRAGLAASKPQQFYRQQPQVQSVWPCPVFWWMLGIQIQVRMLVQHDS